jgi:hypothetical protein
MSEMNVRLGREDEPISAEATFNRIFFRHPSEIIEMITKCYQGPIAFLLVCLSDLDHDLPDNGGCRSTSRARPPAVVETRALELCERSPECFGSSRLAAGSRLALLGEHHSDDRLGVVAGTDHSA